MACVHLIGEDIDIPQNNADVLVEACNEIGGKVNVEKSYKNIEPKHSGWSKWKHEN